MEHDGNPFAHFFLWKAGGNPVSKRQMVAILNPARREAVLQYLAAKRTASGTA
jgi:hypothetical protein